jgi:hypothetical protein
LLIVVADNFASLPCLCILAFSVRFCFSFQNHCSCSSNQAAFTAGVYVVSDPTTMETRVQDRRPRDIAAQRYTETLFAGGEAIAYHAEASTASDASTTEQSWKAESAKHKAVATALQAVAAAQKTVDAAMDVTHSSFGKGWRNELKVAEMKILAAASPSAKGAMKEEGKIANVADASRDVIDVARRAADAAAKYIAAHPEETVPAS